MGRRNGKFKFTHRIANEFDTEPRNWSLSNLKGHDKVLPPMYFGSDKIVTASKYKVAWNQPGHIGEFGKGVASMKEAAAASMVESVNKKAAEDFERLRIHDYTQAVAVAQECLAAKKRNIGEYDARTALSHHALALYYRRLAASTQILPECRQYQVDEHKGNSSEHFEEAIGLYKCFKGERNVKGNLSMAKRMTKGYESTF
jgi:hypothetical protein